jgi:transcription initiation factor TFIID subunit 10
MSTRPSRGKATAVKKSASAAPSTSSTSLRAIIKEKNDFLIALESYTPTIPEAVTRFYMQKSGINAMDERTVKLISLASDHFLAKTVHEAKQMSLLKLAPKTKGTKRKAAPEHQVAEDTMELEDLERALLEQGVRRNG